jgi:transcriptional regulator with XRE-family HTH domain
MAKADTGRRRPIVMSMLAASPSSAIKTSFAARIRSARRALGLSQQQLAERIGIRRAAVTQWESSAGTLPSTINLMQVAIELRVSFEWLATGRGAMRLDDSEGTAFSVDCITQSFEEEQLLALYRRCNVRQREAVIAFLTATAPGRVGVPR